jgi:carbon monoxide dehydrogenase subunit G
MSEFRKSLQLAVSPDQAWAVLGDLANVDRWIPGISHVELEGFTRTCTMTNGVIQHEKITDYSAATHSYGYTIEGSPLPVRNNRGRFSIEQVDQGVLIVWESAFEVFDPAQEQMVEQMWDGATTSVLEALKRVILEVQNEKSVDA